MRELRSRASLLAVFVADDGARLTTFGD